MSFKASVDDTRRTTTITIAHLELMAQLTALAELENESNQKTIITLDRRQSKTLLTIDERE